MCAELSPLQGEHIAVYASRAKLEPGVGLAPTVPRLPSGCIATYAFPAWSPRRESNSRLRFCRASPESLGHSDVIYGRGPPVGFDPTTLGLLKPHPLDVDVAKVLGAAVQPSGVTPRPLLGAGGILTPAFRLDHLPRG